MLTISISHEIKSLKYPHTIDKWFASVHQSKNIY